MCFHLDGHQRAKVAEKDITCWKALDKTSDGKLVSPYKCSRYQFDVVKKAPLRKQASCSISRGLHSYKNKKAGIVSHLPRNVYKAIIPKGSLYYVNASQYVSNRLIILGPKSKKLVAVKVIKKVTVKKKK